MPIKEKFLLRVVLPMVDIIMGTKIAYWYNKISELNTKTPDEIISWQNKQIEIFIKQAYNHTKYYNKLFNELGIKPEDIRTTEDFKKIPPIDKDIIREHYNEIVPDNIKMIKHRKGLTGGTTGMPLQYLFEEDTWGYITAVKIFAWKTTGYHYGDKYAILGSSSLFPVNRISWKQKIYFFLRNSFPLNGMNLSDEIAAKYVKIIQDHKIKYIYGYAVSIYLLTDYIARNNIDMTHIKGVFTTSEILTPEYRTLMEKVYKCRVMDCYGARDGGVTAYEITPGYYHVSYNSIVRLENVSNNSTGTLLLTNLFNKAFPLINYRIGDQVQIKKDYSKYNGMLITKVIGRTSDVMSFDNGHKLTATGFSVMIRDFNVKAFAMKKVDGTTVLLQIQKKDSFKMDEMDKIYNTMKKHVGEEVKVIIEEVEKFEPLKNGKRNYFII